MSVPTSPSIIQAAADKSLGGQILVEVVKNEPPKLSGEQMYDLRNNIFTLQPPQSKAGLKTYFDLVSNPHPEKLPIMVSTYRFIGLYCIILN